MSEVIPQDPDRGGEKPLGSGDDTDTDTDTDTDEEERDG
jgi:hypothetical protein